jgi:hypothetical protein
MPKQCRHLHASGIQCRARRVWKEDYCFFHLHHRTPNGMAKRSEEPPPPPPENGIEIPLLEDAASIQIALTRVLTALAAGKISPTEANSFIYGLRLARLNLPNGGLINGAPVEAYIQYDNGDVVGPEQFREEATTPEHPLLDSGMMALRHLAARLDYEAAIESYLTQGKEPPSDLRPPVLRPSDPEEHKKWVAAGWKAAQTRSMAIEDVRKGARNVHPIPPQKAAPPNSPRYGPQSSGFAARPEIVNQNSDASALARAATTRTGH